MNVRRREVEEALINELKKWEVKFSKEPTKQHPKLRIIDRDQVIIFHYPASASDWRATKNSVASLRQRLRARKVPKHVEHGRGN